MNRRWRNALEVKYGVVHDVSLVPGQRGFAKGVWVAQLWKQRTAFQKRLELAKQMDFKLPGGI